MPIQHRVGDLLASDCLIIAHGCNCFNTMGSGIARAIRAKYPGVYEADCQTIRGRREKLGTYTNYMSPEDQRVIFNLYTQYRYGTDKVHLDYTALTAALMNMKDWLDGQDPHKHFKVGLPRIGCGLAGGEWKRVEEIIESVFDDRTIYVYTLS